MARLKHALAFAAGWLSVAVLQLAAAAPHRSAPADLVRPGSVAWRIAALSHDVAVLERMAAAGKLEREVVAPFEVVSRTGQRLFYVTPQREVEVLQGGRIVAQLSATGEVGTAWALSNSGSVSLTGSELLMKEGETPRLALGKDAKHGNYRLQIGSSGSENIAALGVSSETKGGAALVFDAGGSLRADMTATQGNLGNVAVLAGAKKPAAVLTQSAGAGYLLLCSAASCQPPLVEAMDGGGYGIVGTGPSGWAPGAGFVIAAGSVISGKH
jgi:hypothetical protein